MLQSQGYLQYRNDSQLQIEQSDGVIRIVAPAQGFVRAASHQVQSLSFWLLVACASIGGTAKQLFRWFRPLIESRVMPHVDPWDVAQVLGTPAVFALFLLVIRGREHTILTLEKDHLISTGNRCYRVAKSEIRDVIINGWGVCIVSKRNRRFLPGPARQFVLAFYPRADHEQVAMILREWLRAAD